MDIIIFIAVAVLAALLGWYIAKVRFTSEQGISKEEAENIKKQISELSTDKRIAEERVNNLKSDKEALENKLDELSYNLGEARENWVSEKKNNENLTQKLDEQKEEIDKLQKKFTLEFENLANRIFEEKSRKFTEQNRSNLDDLLKPLGQKIKEFEKKVEETYDIEARQRASLGGEIKKLIEQTQSVEREAKNLATALKGQAKTQGNWGEMILESLLENSGLEKDREYFIQKSYIKDGRRLQPDVVVKFPGQRDMVIDAKVSLVAYERFSSAETKEKQDIALKEHLNSIKRHIDELSMKNYQEIYDLNTLEFVMLFIPIEPAYLTAMKGNPELWNYAYNKRILLISPTNLIAILKMTENLWQQEIQRKNVREIARQGGDLYDKFVGFVNDLQNIGKKIDDSKLSYDAAMKKLSEGKGNLISRAEKLRELGAKTKKTLPQELLDRADDKSDYLLK
ncbi:DNA recombination protein RmuC [Bacteroidota bacterium]